VYCYAIIFSDLTTAMCLGLASLFVRQFGHAVLEPACHDEEKLLLGYTTREKTFIVLGYALVPLVALVQAGSWTFGTFVIELPTIALHWFRWTVFVVSLRVVYLIWKHDFRTSMIWFVKLVSDPFTDIVTYFPRRTQRA
jgi:glutamate-1-semialdehyde 2,1-aminomutase